MFSYVKRDLCIYIPSCYSIISLLYALLLTFISYCYFISLLFIHPIFFSCSLFTSFSSLSFLIFLFLFHSLWYSRTHSPPSFPHSLTLIHSHTHTCTYSHIHSSSPSLSPSLPFSIPPSTFLPPSLPPTTFLSPSNHRMVCVRAVTEQWTLLYQLNSNQILKIFSKAPLPKMENS